MQFRLHTSKRTQEIFDNMYQREYLQPFALAKLSISLALHDGFRYLEKNELCDTNGIELNRQTITGENDSLFKALIEMNEGVSIQDEDYFPDYVKAYIDFGAVLLEQEYRYGTNFYEHLLNLDKGI